MESQVLEHPNAGPEGLDGSAKRRQIMEGARTVFLADGFDGASMNDIARVAGVSKGNALRLFRIEGAALRGADPRGAAQAGRAADPIAPSRRATCAPCCSIWLPAHRDDVRAPTRSPMCAR